MFTYKKMTSFKELGLQDDLLLAVKKLGFYEPTPIQAASIPIILQGHDLIASSSTGSGKTFAFAAGIIHNITPGRGVQALIQVPTRELAEQMHQTFSLFIKKSNLSVAVVYGGVSISPQIKALQRADIVIGTPGRTLDHLERRTLSLKALRHIILDEADRMLDMGFLPSIKNVLKQCPSHRQTLLFSATMPQEIVKLSQTFMREPKKISLEEQVDPQKLSQQTYLVPREQKIPLLVKLIQEEHDKELIIVFTNTRRETDRVAKQLKKERIKAAPIHGGLSQNQRLKVIKLFNTKNNLNVLVCTDVAARGLDIPGVSHVYNYDLPNESKQYLHRIGRTARAGADGKAINLVSNRDQANYRDILKHNKLRISNTPLPELPPVTKRVREDERPETQVRQKKQQVSSPKNRFSRKPDSQWQRTSTSSGQQKRRRSPVRTNNRLSK
jgi:ATP-dependent RNA helicase DeaD